MHDLLWKIHRWPSSIQCVKHSTELKVTPKHVQMTTPSRCTIKSRQLWETAVKRNYTVKQKNNIILQRLRVWFWLSPCRTASSQSSQLQRECAICSLYYWHAKWRVWEAIAEFVRDWESTWLLTIALMVSSQSGRSRGWMLLASSGTISSSSGCRPGLRPLRGEGKGEKEGQSNSLWTKGIQPALHLPLGITTEELSKISDRQWGKENYTSSM